MKRFLMCAIVLMASVALNVLMAQTPEEMQASKERYAKLEKAIQKAPKECSVKDVDKLAASVTATMAESVAITPLLEGLYYRSVGKTEDGVTEVTVKKPTLDECLELSARIALQAKAVQAATESVEPAAKAVKDIKNPLKGAKALKVLDYSKDALAVVAEETAYQTKAIASIIETIKSADNL